MIQFIFNNNNLETSFPKYKTLRYFNLKLMISYWYFCKQWYWVLKHCFFFKCASEILHFTTNIALSGCLFLWNLSICLFLPLNDLHHYSRKMLMVNGYSVKNELIDGNCVCMRICVWVYKSVCVSVWERWKER